MSRANATRFESAPPGQLIDFSALYAAPPVSHLRSNHRADSNAAKAAPPGLPGADASPPEPATAPAAAAAARPLSYDVIDDQAGFCALETEWNELFEQAGRPTQVFQTFSWNWHWCRHFVWNAPDGPKHAALLVTARDNGRLVMVWPLAMERVGMLRQLVWMGEPVSQYGDILADTDTVTQSAILEAWAFALKALKPDVVRLRRVRADAVIAPHLATLQSLETVVNEAPHLDLASAADFAAYEQRYSGKARKNRRRLARRLEEQGVVKYARLSQTPEAGQAARQAVAMKQSWLRDRGLLSPALADSRFAAFMGDVAAASGRGAAGVTVSVLTLNDATVGLQIGVTAKQRLSLHVIVYDLAHEKSGVGVLHLEHAIAEAYDLGLTAIDLLAPKADYKMDWADGTVAVIDHALPVSALGRIYAHLYLGFVRERAKLLVQRLPSSITRHLVARR
jgi:CelD/BcsL family acetyltransferase involved in cellulose biosynthesis